MAQIFHSKREALYSHLKEEITTGRYAPGARLPSEAELGRLHGVSRTTVRVSLARLEAEGLIASGQGARPVVLKPATSRAGVPAVGDLVVVLGHERLVNPVTQSQLSAIAHQMPATSTMRVTYTDVPASERLLIGPRDVVVVDSVFARRGFPLLAPPDRTVVLNEQSSIGGFLVTDNRLGGKMIGEHLLAKGHRDVGVLHFGPHEQEFARRLAACRATLRSGGATLEAVALDLHSHEDVTVKQALELLFRRRPTITAVICVTDRMAIEVYGLLAEFGKRVPEDISVMGFDGLESSAWLTPPLTTVRHCYEDMARLLIRALSGKQGRLRSQVRPILVPGASVAMLTPTARRKTPA